MGRTARSTPRWTGKMCCIYHFIVVGMDTNRRLSPVGAQSRTITWEPALRRFDILRNLRGDGPHLLVGLLQVIRELR